MRTIESEHFGASYTGNVRGTTRTELEMYVNRMRVRYTEARRERIRHRKIYCHFNLLYFGYFSDKYYFEYKTSIARHARLKYHKL
jgi:hypothetical protein